MIIKSLYEIALQFEGVKEIENNFGFSDKKLEEMMIACGWQKGYAWCSTFAQVCTELYLTQFNTSLIDNFRKCFSVSATATFTNFKASYPDIVFFEPKVDSIVFWQNYINGQPSWQGHAGIVKDWNKTFITSIDGNTNIHGSRDGDGVFTKTRLLDTVSKSGLKIIGYVQFKRPNYDY